MKSVGEQLKAAREAKGLSLNDISQITRINRKYLEEIEQNITPQLPPTYVNAFLKAFAHEVNLDPKVLNESLSASHVVPEMSPGAKNAEHTDPDHTSTDSLPKSNSVDEAKGQKKICLLS